jgi:sulfotransferase famil protein
VYAFIHIDKTGGTTMTSILRRSFGSRHCDIRLPMAKRPLDGIDHRSVIDAADLRRVQRIYRRLYGISGHNVKAYSDLHVARPDIRFFTILRDPVARFRSQFLNRAKDHRTEGFESWVKDKTMHNWQTRMIAGESSARTAIDLLSNRIGFVWFTEQFDEGLILLGQWLGLPEFRPEYNRENQLSLKRRPHDVARQKRDLGYLDSDPILRRIQEVNAEDQKVYDFATRILYPQQVANYRGDLTSATRELKNRNAEEVVLSESTGSTFMRNYVYKPLLHCRAA